MADDKENAVIAFKNTKDYPIAIDVRFGGRPFKLTLWRDEIYRDRAGKALIPDKSEWPRLMRMGIQPVYSNAPAPKLQTSIEEEVILNDAALMEARKRADEQAAKVEEFDLKSIESVDEDVKPVGHLERKDNPNPDKADLVWQDGDGVWIFNKDGQQNISPAKVKAHIKKVYGEDYLDKVEFLRFGEKVKPETETETES